MIPAFRSFRQFLVSISSQRFLATVALSVVAITIGINAQACHNSSIDNVVTVNNGNGTYTYTINVHVEVGSFDGYGYGFALLFENSFPIQPMVLSGFTPQVTRPGYDPLIGYTGSNIGSGPIPFFGQRYGNSANILTYETTDDWWGFGSTPYDVVVTVTVSGCIESISLDGDFRSMGNAVGDLACMDVYSTGMTCCPGGTLTGNVNEMICPGETFVYAGTVYNENNLTGTHVISNSQGCDSIVTVQISIDPNCCNPETPAISGPSTLCSNASGNVYSVPNEAGSSYNWTVPVGAIITSGQGTNSITVSFGSSGGQIAVVETEPCGVAPQQTFNVQVDPQQILTITDPNTVCAPSTVDLTTASVTAGSTGGGSFSYWTNAAATNSLANPSSVSTSGTYYVQMGSGACADIQPVTVTIQNPQNSSISGPTPLCENASGNIYSVSNTPGSTYTWSVPVGASITSGQGTNSIMVDFGSTGGQVSVIETLACGNGPQVTMNVVVNASQNLVVTDPAATCAPNTVDLTAAGVTVGSTGGGSLTYWTDPSATSALANPSAVAVSGTYYIRAGSGACADLQPVTVTIGTPQTSVITGPTPLCENSSGNVYSVTNTPGSTYTWTVPAGASIASGQGTNSITVDFATAGGQITVFETLSCGNGQPVSFTVAVDPIQNLSITDPTAACAPNTVDLTAAAVTAGSSGGGALTYWTDPAATSALANPSAVAVSGTYYIQAGIGACADVQPVTVTIDNCVNCTMTGLNFVMTSCDNASYDLEGTLTYSNPPTTGILTITDCNGNQEVFNPPFNGSQTLTYSGLPQDGLFCNYTAVFSDDPNCTITVGFQAPNFITTSTTEDCQTGTVSVSIVGGLPAINGGDFTASGLLPATANFVNSTAGNNGTIVVEGLQNGDVYSFEIQDVSGCPVTVSGGPFVAGPSANAGVDGQSCLLSFGLLAVASSGVGTWTGGPTGSTFTPSSNDPNATVTVPTAGTYTFTWTEDNGSGCPATDDVEITFSSMAIPAVITNASCGASDGEITVAPQGGTAPFTYAWSSGGTSVTETGLGAGSVTVTVSDNAGCSLDSTFIISQPTAFSYDLTTADAGCFGACDGIIDVQPTIAGTYSYTWTPNVSTSNSSNTLCAGDYEIIVADQNGCTQVVTTTILGSSSITVDMSSDVSEICVGGSASLSSTVNGGIPGYTYTWTAAPSDPTLNASIPDPVVSPIVTTTYTLVVEDANGCGAPPKNVTIEVLPELTISSTNVSICPGEDAVVSATAFGGDGNYTYYLFPDDVNPVQLPLVVQPASTMTLEFMVTDGCETPAATTTSIITVHEIPSLTIDASPSSGCAPLVVDFSDLTQPTPLDWSWDFGDPLSSGSQSQYPSHTYQDPGVYSISLSVTTAEGCAAIAELTNFVEVFAVPNANFEMSASQVSLMDAEIEFADRSEGTIEGWYWDFGDGGNGSGSEEEYTYTEPGTYTVGLEVVTVDGCTDEIYREVTVEEQFAFYVPNAFTPNNDRDNPIFKGEGEGIDPATFQMTILNRWGDMVFRTSNIDRGWDGSYQGEQVEMAVYAYEISFNDYTGKAHYFRGHVTLTR